jgi:triosephosphate isomerase (TIM)
MAKALMVGNWKMHTTHLETIQIVQKLSYRLEPGDYQRVDPVVAPPFTALRSAQTVIEADHLLIGLGAQNVFWEDEGAYTGEISPTMLAKLAVRYVIVGHSERRRLFGETDADVNRKVAAVLRHDMTPIMCVGETEGEREAGVSEDRVSGQVLVGLQGMDAVGAAATVIAYEPIWAIGTGRTASPDDAGAMASFIRGLVAGQWAESAESVRILYGGSVNPGNIAGLMAKRDIDGALVGGASLDPDEFASIVRYWA